MRKLLRGLAPPLAIELYRGITRSGLQLSGVYPDWATAERHTEGYDSTEILEKVRIATQKVINGEAIWERDSVVFDFAQYPFPLISILLRSAFEESGSLSVIDFGGALGSSYYQCRDFLEKVPNVKWCVVEQHNFAECGRREFQNGILSFYDNFNTAINLDPPNLILASGVLQYLPEPFQIIEAFVRARPEYIVIDRTPFVVSGMQVISVQSVSSAIVSSSYPLWLFNEEQFKMPILNYYDEIISYPSVDGTHGYGKLKSDFKGFIFKKKPIQIK